MQDHPIYQAIIRNDKEIVKNFAKDGGDWNLENALGFSPLQMAFLLGKGDCIRDLGGSISQEFKILCPNHHITSKYSIASLLEQRGIAYWPTLRFSSYSYLEKIFKACPKILLHTRWGEQARKIGNLYQQEIFSGKTAPLTVVWIGGALGYGVICQKNLTAGEWIGCYAGWVRPIKKATPWINRYCVLYPTDWFHRGSAVIDARLYGNLLRYVNHSDTPNLYANWALDRQLLHLLFFAQTDIPRGTFLTINYGIDYWQHRVKI